MSENYNDTPSPLWHNDDSESLPYTNSSIPYDVAIPYEEVPAPSSNAQRVVPPVEPAEPRPLTEEDKLAAAHQLGEVISIYKNDPPLFPVIELSMPRNPRLLLLYIFGPLFFVGFWINGSVPHWVLLLFLCAICSPWLSIFFGRLPRAISLAIQNTEFVQCTSGLMIIKRSRVQAVRWEQIRAVQQIRRSDIGRTILFLGDGEPLPIDRSLVGAEFVNLSRAIEREVRRHQLPRAIAAYEAGQTLNFGPVNVTPEGFLLEGGQQSLPWLQVADIDICNGNLIMKKKGSPVTVWEEFDLAGMLNLCVLLPLLQHIWNVLHANEQPAANENTTYYEPSEPMSEWSEYEY